MAMMTVIEVMELCKVSEGKAYKLMREVNKELERKGYITIRGRVNSKFLKEKLGMVGD